MTPTTLCPNCNHPNDKHAFDIVVTPRANPCEISCLICFDIETKRQAHIPRSDTPKVEINDPLLKLPGAQQLLQKCNIEEQRVISTLFASKEKAFTSKSLKIWLGNQLKNISFSKLNKLGLVKKTKEGYQADQTLGGAMK
jgi:hypothetical protein